MQQTILSLS